MPRPRDLEDFVERPSMAEWNAELRRGWSGPDGSSRSTDTIMGVRIGITSRSYRWVNLPANRHDWYYRLGRRWRLPESWRREADRRYRDLCLALVRLSLVGWRAPLRPLAVARCHARYAVLRVAARFAWTQKAKGRNAAWKGGG